ncbi:MAG: hypothetical protein IPN71_13530 [Fibrobacteres bacterium]|nr:hypothetical protein [Fibrobacterota bacterium]
MHVGDYRTFSFSEKIGEIKFNASKNVSCQEEIQSVLLKILARQTGNGNLKNNAWKEIRKFVKKGEGRFEAKIADHHFCKYRFEVPWKSEISSGIQYSEVFVMAYQAGESGDWQVYLGEPELGESKMDVSLSALTIAIDSGVNKKIRGAPDLNSGFEDYQDARWPACDVYSRVGKYKDCFSYGDWTGCATIGGPPVHEFDTVCTKWNRNGLASCFYVDKLGGFQVMLD